MQKDRMSTCNINDSEDSQYDKIQELLNKINQGELICIDGATGTELQNRGYSPPWDASSLPAQLYNPKVS